MDALALLCNLHADGPTTLHQLRAAGCDSILDAASRDVDDLERILGWSPKIVRRFQREARILADRVDDGILEEAPDDVEKIVRPFRPSGFLEEIEREAISPDAPAPDATAKRQAELEPETLPARDRLVPARESEPRSAGDGGLTDEEDFEEEELEEGVPAPEVFLDRPLTSEVCDGLTGELVDQLARAGVCTLGGLVDGDVLEISSLIGIGYTRLARIHFLVRRHLEGLEAGASRGVDVIPPCPPPGDRLEASGPFA